MALADAAASTLFRDEADLRAARRIWQAVEGLHAVYLDPAGIAPLAAAGLKGGWMRYFASRSCPLGAASAELVTSTFYVFAPRLVERAIPDAWSHATPEAVHAARLDAADAGIKERFPDLVTSDLGAAVELAEHAARACDVQGRPLFAAHAAVEWPEPLHLRLWWAATLLREYRGDGHIAALVSHGIGPLPALVTHVATGELPADFLKPIRGWTDEEWDETTAELEARGLVDGEGRQTDAGAALRRSVEDTTNALALPWPRLEPDLPDRLLGALRDVGVR